MDLASLPTLLIAVGLGAAAMYAFQRFGPDVKTSAAKDATRAVKRLVKVLGADDTEDAKRRRDELKRALESLEETVKKVPEVK